MSDLVVIGETKPVAIDPYQRVMEMAIEKGSDLAVIEKMMELQERREANEAKKAYVAAMSEFKKAPLKILKDKDVAFNNTKYSHASLGNVTDAIGSELSKHGLSAAWETKQDQSEITVTCTLTHSMGHSESTSLMAPPDSSGKKNNIQAIGSTVSYLQRYTILSITGVATHDQDDDGASSELQLLDVKQVSTITDLVNSVVNDAAAFYMYLTGLAKTEILSPEDIPAKMYNQVVSELKILGSKQ